VIATLPREPTPDSVDSSEADLDEMPEVSIDQIESMAIELARVQVTLAQVAIQASRAVWKGAFGGALIVVIVAAFIFIV